MKKLLITLCSIGLAVGIAQGQQYGDGPGSMDGSGDGSGFMGGPGFEMPDLDPEVLAEITALREEIVVIRQTLRESRDAILADLGDVTDEERLAALANWREDNAGTFDELRTLTDELRAIIQENRPDRPFIDIPEEILTKREELRNRRQALAESRRQVILNLGDDPTDEAVRSAMEAWRTENADELAAVQALATEIRDWFRENRPMRPHAFDTPRMLARRAAFRDNVQTMRQNRRELRNQMSNPDLTEEQRRELIQAFREEQRDLMRERQMLKRQERLDQGGVGGDRRPGG